MRQLRIHRLFKQDPSSEERSRIEALLDDYNEYVREQFTLFLNSVRDPAVLAEVEQAISEGRTLDAFSIIDEYMVRLGDAVVARYPEVGRQEAEALAVQDGIAGAGVSVSFNPGDERVVAAMQRNRLEFITEITAEQRLAVGAALSRATEQGLGTAATARAIRDSIGLTMYQQGIVDNYRAVLEANSRQALDYALRDRRYDRGVENAIEADEVLSPERIDLMVDRYRERFLQLRAETIARTEGGRVAEDARYAATVQAAEAAGIPVSRVVKVWSSTEDQRRRDTHREMQGQARLLEDAFDSPSGAQLMYPHDSDAPAEEVINCRCVPQFLFFTTDAEVRAFLLENGQGYYDDKFTDEDLEEPEDEQ